MNNKLDIAYNYYNEEKYKESYTLFSELAEENNLDAQIMLASMYYDGYGIKKNIKKSYSWYKIAADNGDASSSNFYSFYCFENKNILEGKQYLQRAVNANYVDAIYNMAIYYLNGDNEYTKNEEKAIILFKKSALLDDMESYFQIWKIIAKRSTKKDAYTYMVEEFGFPPCFKMIKYRFIKFLKRVFRLL